jgi:hypothetical protein
MNKILLINELIKNEELDNFTKNKLLLIKNDNFKDNIFDIRTKKIVSSIYLKNIKNKILLWTYYRDRGKKNVDEILNLYNNEDLIINYSIDKKS